MWIITFCIFLFLLILERSLKPGRLYPPGPPTLPFVGNLLSVIFKSKKELVFKIWHAWSRQYGEILGLRLGIANVVVVFGRDNIKDVSSREVFNGRPDGFFYTMRSFGKKIGIVFGDGPKWTTTRRFVLKFLKNFGYNSTHVERYIEEECRNLVKLRMNDDGRPVVVNHMFNVPVVNIMWRLVAGKRYNLDDDRLIYLSDLVMKLFKAVDMSGGLLNFMPFLRHIMPDIIGFTKVQELQNQIHEFIEETIKEHEQNIDVQQPKDVIDAFLIEMLEQKDQLYRNSKLPLVATEIYFRISAGTIQTKTRVTKEDLHVVCLDLLEAGLETVSNTSVFLILHLVRDQAIQWKLQQEIDEVIGNDVTPTINERTRMVYTEAVILETLRISSVAPVGIPHMALADARLGDYIIPKGTFILLAMHDLHNGDHWNDPYVFRPERFLTKDGELVQSDCLMPFGHGKRRCIGEGLAKSELFLFLTHLLQRFNLRLPQGESLPSTEPVEGLTLSAKPFRVIFEPRY